MNFSLAALLCFLAVCAVGLESVTAHKRRHQRNGRAKKNRYRAGKYRNDRSGSFGSSSAEGGSNSGSSSEEDGFGFMTTLGPFMMTTETADFMTTGTADFMTTDNPDFMTTETTEGLDMTTETTMEPDNGIFPPEGELAGLFGGNSNNEFADTNTEFDPDFVGGNKKRGFGKRRNLNRRNRQRQKNNGSNSSRRSSQRHNQRDSNSARRKNYRQMMNRIRRLVQKRANRQK